MYLFVLLFVSIVLAQPSYKELYFTQKLDHFNSESVDSSGNPLTYQERYLFSDAYWGKNSEYSSSTCKGPIFFYTGNESPVTDYWTASGFFTQVLAPKYGALLIFAEHRYFGKSIPFPDSPWTPEHIGYLSASQALADYAELIYYLKNTLPMASGCPVFAFGGSYGGMLTTWFRIKYPHMIIGGLAASAPFAFNGTGVSPSSFTDATTATYEDAATGCSTTIKSGLNAMQSLVNTQAGRDQLASIFKICGTLPDSQSAENVIQWVISGLQFIAMLDYPYPTDYGFPLPGWPVNGTCQTIVSINSEPIRALAAGISYFYNYTGKWPCYDINKDIPDFAGCCGWDYLSCTEVYLPFSQSGMFPYSPWEPQYDIARCKSSYGVTLDPNFGIKYWGGFDSIKQSSNIIFSNGLLDPWHTSGVLESLSDSLIAIVIPAAAHHLDLRGPDPDDPVYVQIARSKEDAIIGKWLSDYFNK